MKCTDCTLVYLKKTVSTETGHPANSAIVSATKFREACVENQKSSCFAITVFVNTFFYNLPAFYMHFVKNLLPSFSNKKNQVFRKLKLQLKCFFEKNYHIIQILRKIC